MPGVCGHSVTPSHEHTSWPPERQRSVLSSKKASAADASPFHGSGERNELNKYQMPHATITL